MRSIARERQTQFKVPNDISLEEIEEAAIAATLERCEDNRTRTANKLDISVQTLQRKLARANEHVAKAE